MVDKEHPNGNNIQVEKKTTVQTPIGVSKCWQKVIFSSSALGQVPPFVKLVRVTEHFKCIYDHSKYRSCLHFVSNDFGTVPPNYMQAVSIVYLILILHSSSNNKLAFHNCRRVRWYLLAKT